MTQVIIARVMIRVVKMLISIDSHTHTKYTHNTSIQQQQQQKPTTP